MTKERSHLDIHLGGGVTVTSSTESRALGGSETLASLGVQVHKVAQTSTVSTGEIALSNHQVTRYTMRLPVSTGLQASFRKESWGDSLVKIFKKELQTGDPAFDKLIYISTDTLERTRAFLTPEVREAISFTVDMGGSVEIAGDAVTALSGGIDAPGEDDRTIVRLVKLLLAFATQSP